MVRVVKSSPVSCGNRITKSGHGGRRGDGTLAKCQSASGRVAVRVPDATLLRPPSATSDDATLTLIVSDNEHACISPLPQNI